MKDLSLIPRVGVKREKILRESGIGNISDVSKLTPINLRRILHDSISMKEAESIILSSKIILTNNRNNNIKKYMKILSLISGGFVSAAAFALLSLELYNNFASFYKSINDENEISVFFSQSLKDSYEKKSAFEVRNEDTSIVNIGFDYQSIQSYFNDKEVSLCSPFPFLIDLKSKENIDRATIIFDVFWPEKNTVNVARKAGYGNYLLSSIESCAYGEKTLFNDDLDRALLNRKFIHEPGHSKVVYDFKNLIPGRKIPISISLNLIPTAFLITDPPISHPFTKYNSDFSRKALEGDYVELVSEPIKIKISSIVKTGIKEIGEVFVFVHPAKVDADVAFNSFRIMKDRGLGGKKITFQYLFGGSLNFFISHAYGIEISEKVINELLPDEEDSNLLDRQKKENNVYLSQYSAPEKIKDVLRFSDVFGYLGEYSFFADNSLRYPVNEFNKQKNSFRSDLILSRQFPSLFKKYTERSGWED